MEMTRKPPASSSTATTTATATVTEEEATSLLRPAATPFSSETERRHLERAFFPSPSPSSATERHEPLVSRPSGDGGRHPQQRQRQQQEQIRMQFVPTAVPIPISEQDELAGNLASTVAVAVARPIPATATSSSSASSSVSSSRATTPKTVEQNKNTTNKHDDHPPKTEHDSDILVRPSPPTTTITTLHTPTHARSTTRRLLRRAQLHGTLSSESEKEDIRRAQRERNALRYHAARAVEAANEAAARRERGGWTSFEEGDGRGREGELDGESGMEERGEDARRFGTILANGERGYEVAEYDIGKDYEVQEYDVKEYKSVYE